MVPCLCFRASLCPERRSALGLDAARQLYARLLAVAAPGGDLYRAALRVEEVELAAERSRGASGSGRASPQAVKRLTSLYEAAVAAYGGSEGDLWLSYAAFLMAQAKGAGRVYWRAVKELVEPDPFVEEYRRTLGAVRGAQ